MTAQTKYITSVIKTFSTYLESLNISEKLSEEATSQLVNFLQQKKNLDSWSMTELEKFVKTEKISSNTAVLIRKFIKDFTPHQVDIFLHQFLSSLKDEQKSKSTIKNYKSDISQLISLIGVNKIANLFTQANIKKFVKQQFSKDLKASTVKRKLTSIAQFAIWAEDQKLVENVSFWISDVEGLFGGRKKVVKKQKTTSEEVGFRKPAGLPFSRPDKSDINISKNSNLSSANPDRGDVEIGGIEPPRLDLSSQLGKPAIPTSNLNISQNKRQIKPKSATALLEKFLNNLKINKNKKSGVKNQKTTSEEVGFGKPTGLPFCESDKLSNSLSKNTNLSSVNPDRGDVEIGGIEPPKRNLSDSQGKPAIPTSNLNISQNKRQIKPKSATALLGEFLAGLKIAGSSKSTIKNYKSDISQLISFVDEKLSNKKLKNQKTASEEADFGKPVGSPFDRPDKLSNILSKIITQDNLKKFLEYQKVKGLKLKSIQRKVVSISQFSAWAEEKGDLEDTTLWVRNLNTGKLDSNDLNINKSPIEIPDSKPVRIVGVDHSIELKLKDKTQIKVVPPVKTKREGWSLPMPKFIKEKGKAKMDLESREGMGYKSRLKTSLKEFSASINTKKKKTFLPYFNLVMIVLFILGIGYFGYQQLIKQTPGSLAYPTTPTRPNRELSFQGRLTDTAQNPVTTATNMAFRLYDDLSAGTLLWDSSTCSVTPDQDGIFNVGLGDDCGSEISENVFTENSNVWLEVDVAAETLTPRQSIKTVAYALNAETVQGYPVSATGAATTNTILVMDAGGQVVLGEVSPTFKSTTGTFSIEAQALTLQTSSGSNGDIILDPDGLGEVLSTGYFSAPGATFSATYTGGTSLVLKGGPSGTGNIQEWQDSSGTVLSVVDESGNVGIGTNSPEALLNIKDATDSTFLKLEGTGTGANTYDVKVSSGGALQILDGATALLYMKGGTSFTVYTANTVFNETGGDYDFRVEGDADADLLFVDAGNDIVQLGKLNINGAFTFPTADGTTSYILQTDGSGTVTWVDPALASATGVHWAASNGAIYPKNSTMDVFFGGQASSSANFAFLNNDSGTPTASISGNLVLNSAGTIQTTNDQLLTIGGDTTGSIFLDGNVGVGTGSPQNKLEIVSSDSNALGLYRVTGTIGHYQDFDFDLTGNGVRNTYATIRTEVQDSSATWDGILRFFVAESGSQSEVATFKAGFVGIGEASPTLGKLQVSGDKTWVGYFDNTQNSPAKGGLYINTQRLSDANSIEGARRGVTNYVIRGDGKLILGGSSPLARLHVVGSADEIQTIIQAHSTQTSNIQEWQNSGATPLISIDGSGRINLIDSVAHIIDDISGDLTLTSNSTSISLNDNVTFAGTTTLNSIAYTWPASQTTSYILQTNGSGTLSWVDPALAAADSIYWTTSNGSLYPKNSTMDVFFGGQASSSANFAFLNNDSGTPTASISGNLVLNSAGILSTTDMQTLTIGDSSTGNIALTSGGNNLLFQNTTDAVTGIQFFDADGGTPILNIDTTNERVGIGTGAPQSKMDIYGNLRFGKASGLAANIISRDNAAGSNYRDLTIIGNNLNFKTATTDEGSSSTSRLYISNITGNVGIGESAPSSILEILSSTSPQFTISYSNGTDTTFGTDVNGDLTITPSGLDTNILGSLTLTDYLFAPGATLSASIAGNVPLTVIGAGSQTANLFEVKDSGGNVLSGVDERGVVFSDGGIDGDSVYLGSDAGNIGHTDATYNIGIGTGSLNALTAGDYNVGVGYSTGASLTTGISNIAIGVNALDAETTGSQSIAIGQGALSAQTLSVGHNTAIGHQAGFAVTTGESNIFLGYTAGRSQTTLSNLFIVDNQARADVATELTNSILYGVMASTPGSQTLRINAVPSINGAYTLPIVDGTANYILQTDGSGAATWVDPAGAAADAIYWTSSLGSLYPKNSTMDVFFGGQASSSANFAFLNNDSGTPTASISGNLVLNSAGTIQTTNDQLLTVGGDTTGSIFLDGNVGVGTDTPIALLQVHGNGTTPRETILLSNQSNTTPDYSTIFPSIIDSQTSGFIGASSNGAGGLALSGFVKTGGTATPPISITGYQTGDPTLATILIRGAKHDGSTSGTSISATSPLLKVRNWGTDLLTILGSGNLGLAETSPISQLSIGAGSDTAVTDGTTASSVLGVNISITDDSAYAMGILNSNISGDGLLIQAGDASDDYALRVEDYDSANDLLVVRGDGTIGIGNSAPDAKLDIDGTSDEIQLIIQANGTQTTNLTEWQNSGSNVIANIDSLGHLTLGSSSAGTNTIFDIPSSTSINNSGYIYALDFSPTLISSDNHVYGAYVAPTVTIPNTKFFVGVTAAASSLTVSAGTGNYAGLWADQPTSLTGTLANSYGLYVNNINQATANYAIYTNAGSNMFNAGGDANTDFTVQGDTDADLLFVNAGNDIVQLGKLNINGAFTFPTADGTTSYILQTDGSGTVTWVDPALASATGVHWTVSNGSLYPKNSTMDVFFGGQASSSANFAFLNNDSGTPTASISGNLVLNSAGILSTTDMQTLTIGDTSTGNIALTSGGNNLLFQNTTDAVTGIQFMDADGGTPILNIDTTNERVGIGIAAPNATLDVVGNIQQTFNNPTFTWTSGAITFVGPSSTSALRLRTTGVESLLPLKLSAGSEGSPSLTFISSATTGIFRAAADEIGISIAGNEKIRIDSSGQFGIGTTTPTALLDVAGTASISGELDLYGTAQLQSTSQLSLTLGGDTTGAILLQPNTDTGDYFQFTSDGTDLTLSTTDASDLDIKPAGNNLTFQNSVDATTGVQFFDADGGTPILNIDTTNERVGIGTDTPVEKLDVVGKINITAGDGDYIQLWHSGSEGSISTNSGPFSLSPASGLAYVYTSGVNGDFRVYGSSGSTNYLKLSHDNSNGTISTAVGDLLLSPTTGNVTFSGTTTLNSIAYTWPASQTTSYILQTDGSGTLSWVDPAGAAADAIYWTSSLGSLYPKNSTMDVFFGGQASSSANFAFLNNDSGTPTASISGNLVLNSAGTIQTTKDQLLTIGGDTTGSIFLDGNVGVGTTAPGFALHVDSDSGGVTSQVAMFEGGSTDNDLTEILVGKGTGVYDSAIFGFHFDNLTTEDYGYLKLVSGTTALVWDKDGNIGIGTTTPTALLDVDGNASTSGTLSFRGTANPYINILNDEDFGINFSPGGDTGLSTKMKIYGTGYTDFFSSEGNNQLRIGRYATENLSIYVDDQNTIIESVQDENSPGYGNMIFRVDDDGTADGYFSFQNKSVSEFMRITSDGDVGIGISAPKATLQVGDTGLASAFADTAALFDSEGSNTRISIIAPTESILQFGDDSDEDAASIIYNHSSDYMDFRVNAVNSRMRITAGGIVGINETVNDNMTQGLTINQGASDDEILALKSSDINHPNTGEAEADTFATFKKASGTKGGLVIKAYVDSISSGSLAGISYDVGDLTITGASTSWLEHDFNASDVTAASALTIDSAATIHIDGAPSAVGSATITDSYALWVDTGNSRFDGGVLQNGIIGFDVIPGSDTDADLLTVQVTGTPTLSWDETNDGFSFNNDLIVTTLDCTGNANGGALTADVNGVISCTDDDGGGASGMWTESLGSISPNNSTWDVLIGGTATTSAKFAFLNVDSGTPTASISGTTANVATYLTGEGVLGTTNMASLTIGSGSTGDIMISPNGSNGFSFKDNGSSSTIQGLSNSLRLLTTRDSDDIIFTVNDIAAMQIDATNQFVGIGDTTPDALLDLTDTTEQLRLSYETGDTNYASFTLSSAGDLTIAPTGGDLFITGNTDISGHLAFGTDGAVDSNIGVVFAETFTADADQYASYSTPVFGFTATANRTLYGNRMYLTGDSSLDENGNAITIYGDHLEIKTGNSDDVSNLFGSYIKVNNPSQNTVANITGQVIDIRSGSGVAATTTSATGINLDITGANSSTITFAYGLDIDMNETFGGTITNAYGITSNCGTVTSCYSATLTANNASSTNNYALLLTAENGTSQNYGIMGYAGDWVLDNDGDGIAGGTGAGGDLVLGEDQDLELYHDGTNSYIMNNAGDLYIGDAGTDDVILSNNGGNVGIGTTSPTSLLHLEGAITGKALAIFNETGDQDIFTASASGVTKFKIANDGYVTGERFVDLTNSSYFLDPAASSTSLTTAGSIGIKRLSPTVELDIDGSASISGQLTILGASPGYINQLNGNDFTIRTSPGGDVGLADRVTIANSGNVGIGTTSPSYNLHIDDISEEVSINIGEDTVLTTDTTGYRISPWSDNNVYLDAKLGSTGKIYYRYGEGAEAANNVWMVVEDGNVGIGTTSPVATLQVEDADQSRFLISESTGTDGDTAELLMKVSSGTDIGYSKGGIIFEKTGANGVGDLHLVNRTTGDSTAASVSDAKLTILSNGDVGIGTTSPDSPLHVLSDSTIPVRFERSDTAANILSLLASNASGAGTDNQIVQLAFSAETETEGTNGSLGSIRYTITDATVGTIDSDISLINYKDSVVQIPFHINADGQIGIGTTAPSSQLHLFRDDTTTSLGQVLIQQSGTGDASTQYSITGVTNWITGVDNSDANSLKFSDSNALGTSDVLTLTTAGNLNIDTANAYLNFGATDGTTGYGFRDNAGNMEFKDSGGAWTNFSGGGSSEWTLTSGVVHPNGATSDLAVGGTTLAASIFSIDESAGIFLFGGDQSANPILRFEATDSDTGDFGFNTNDAFYFTGANVGVGTDAPETSLHLASGSLLLANSSTQGIEIEDNSGNNDLIINYNNNDDLVIGNGISETDKINLSPGGTARLTVYGNGNIGIGDATPDHKLDIEGYYAGNALVSLNETGGNDIFTASASGTTRFVIANDGNVGVGTVTPGKTLHLVSSDDEVLHIEGDDQNNGITLGDDGRIKYSDTAHYFQLHNPNGDFRIGNTYDDTKHIRLYADAGTNTWARIEAGTAYTDGLRFYIGGSDRVTIDDNGNVGIGTTTPTSLLHLDGAVTGKALVIFNETGDQDIFTASASGTTKFIIANDGYATGERFADLSNSSYFLDPAAGSTSLTTAGSVGIKRLSPTVELDIDGSASISGQLTILGASPGYINQLNGNDFTIRTSPGGDVGLADRVTIANSGNVGIGTTSPSYPLDVTGAIKSSGQIISTNANNFRSVFGNYGAFWRNDGTDLYLMKTASGDQYGTWDSDRPFVMNLATGTVSLASTLYVDNSESSVGIGTSLPGDNTLYVYDAAKSLAASGDSQGLYSNITWNDTLTESRSIYGFRSISSNSITVGAYNANLYGGIIQAINNDSYTANVIGGVYGYAQNNSTAATAVALLQAVKGYALNVATGNVTSIYGGTFTAENRSASTTAAGYGVNATVVTNNASANITNAYGLRSRVYEALGTIGTGYGLYADCDDATTCYGMRYVGGDAEVTTDWGLYFTGEDKSYFSGDVGIGVTVPTEKLDIDGGLYMNGNFYIDTQDANPAASNVVGTRMTDGFLSTNRSAAVTANFGRTNDGGILNFYVAGTAQGSISVSGATTSYNPFTGSHYGSTGGIAYDKGTLMSMTGINTNANNNPEDEIIHGVIPSSTENDPTILGSYLTFLEPSQPESNENPSLIMSVGNAPMWVADNGQNINRGDYLISSSVTGHATKDQGNHAISHIVARSAEDINWDDVTTTIDGIKHKRIFIFFESFSKVNGLALDANGDTTLNGIQIIADNPENTSFSILNQSGNLIETMSNFSSSIIANLTAGLITTQELVVDATASITNLSVENLTIGGQPIADYIADIANNIASSQTNDSSLISPLGTDTTISIASESGSILFKDSSNNDIAEISDTGDLTLLGSLTTDSIQADVIQTNTLQTNTLLSNELNASIATVSGTLTVGDFIEVNNSIAIGGDASISGTLLSGEIEATSARITALEAGMAQLEDIKATTAEIVTATISGTLYADDIYNFEQTIADTLQTPGLLDLITGANESTASATYMEELYEIVNKSEFGATTGAELDLNISDLSSIGSDITLTGSALFIEKYFKVNGAGYISDSLAVGNSIFANNSIVVGTGDNTTKISSGVIAYTTANPNDQILKIQPNGQGSIELLAGLVILDDTGLVTINGDFETTGDVKVGKTLLADLIQPTDFGNPLQVQVAGINTQTGEVKESRFEIINEVGDPVATFSAQGKAEFAGGIGIGSQDLGSSITNELDADKTSGKATIKSGANEVKIKTSLITDKTLIYITAVSSTGNQVLYLKSQLPNITSAEITTQEGEFIVGFDNPTTADVSFNWWIVN